MKMRCEDVRRQLDEFRTGETGRRERREIAAHLAECAGCARVSDATGALAGRLKRLRIRTPPDVLGRVRQEIGDRYAPADTDLGRLWVGFNSRGVTMIDAGGGDAASFTRAYEKRIGRRPITGELPEAYRKAVQRAAAGKALPAPRVDLSGLTSFEQTILSLLRKIPRGEVRPYSWLAREAGHPRAARAVGNAMARNPVPLLLPCHRVVPAGGGVGKYAFGAAMKRALLEREGVRVGEVEQHARSGIRFIGCRSTRIYCFPTCRDARRIRPENRVLLANPERAKQAGFVPCRHCKPA